MQTTVWAFGCGHLVARHLAGKALWSWSADEALGRPLADVVGTEDGRPA